MDWVLCTVLFCRKREKRQAHDQILSQDWVVIVYPPAHLQGKFLFFNKEREREQEQETAT